MCVPPERSAMRSRLACVALAALFACGGSEGGSANTTPPPPPCTPITGTWHLSDTLTSTSSAFCAAALRSSTSDVSLTASGPSTFTWTETGHPGLGNFVVNSNGNISGVCGGNITLSLAGTINQPTYQITLIGSRSVAFANNAMSGTSQITLSTSPTQAGTPCTGLYSTSGTR